VLLKSSQINFATREGSSQKHINKARSYSFSTVKGVLRGLHFQTPPFAQDKLVRVTRGSVWDVLVDIRVNSPTYMQWHGIEVSAEKWNQVFIPKGFLHGFVALEDNTELVYKVSAVYAPQCDRAVRFDDPEIGIQWPFKADDIQLSDKDKKAVLLSQIDNDFIYRETK